MAGGAGEGGANSGGTVRQDPQPAPGPASAGAGGGMPGHDEAGRDTAARGPGRGGPTGPGHHGPWPEPTAVDEPPEPRRIRRPPDLIRVLVETGMIAVLLALAAIGGQTTTGLETDIHKSISLAPQVFLSTITLLTNLATAIIPVGLAVERLYRHEGRRVADGVVSAALAYSFATLLDWWITSSSAPTWLLNVLTRSLSGGHTTPLHVYLASVIAFITIVGFGDRPSLQTFTWSCIVAYAAATLISGDSALVGLLVTFLFGRSIAFGWRYARGVINDRPTGTAVLRALREAGLQPAICRWVGETEDTRRYEVDTREGRRLDITVLDRDRQAVGLAYRIYRRVRLRGPAQRRNLLSLRRTVDQEALMSYALREAGIRTPHLLAVRELSADAAMLAYERVEGTTIEELDAGELTEDLLERIWHVQLELQRSQLAHRRLALDSMLVDRDGRIWLLDLRNGEIAAGVLQIRLDTAELLTALSLRFGPERAVGAGARMMGADTMAAALPMLQPVLLTRSTRSAVRKSKNLLSRIREQILTLRPQAPIEPAKLERLRPRTLFTVAAGCLAGYFVLAQFSTTRLSNLAAASPWWVMVAVLASVGTYAAAGMALTGFVPEKLPKTTTFETQVAAGFVSIVAPAAVGGVALNTRYLQKRGIATGPAVAAVSASQAVGFILHITLIGVFGFIAGSSNNSPSGGSAPSTVIIALLLALAIIIMVVGSVPALRKFAVTRLRPFFAGTLPRLLDVAQNPRKLATGLGGTIALSLLYALSLWASIKAVDPNSHLPYANAAVVFLTAQALGSVIPTPGGLGGVELALGAALKTLGVPQFALAVFLFRLVTCYLPVIPGWFVFTTMQRRNQL
jgi:glycosyltransferase 2 family protein